MNGDLPDFLYDPLFELLVSKEERSIQYTLNYSKQEELNRNQTIENLEDSPFICLNNNGRRDEVKSAAINEGDCIKLGKAFFKVVETHRSNSVSQHLQ